MEIYHLVLLQRYLYCPSLISAQKWGSSLSSSLQVFSRHTWQWALILFVLPRSQHGQQCCLCWEKHLAQALKGKDEARWEQGILLQWQRPAGRPGDKNTEKTIRREEKRERNWESLGKGKIKNCYNPSFVLCVCSSMWTSEIIPDNGCNFLPSSWGGVTEWGISTLQTKVKRKDHYRNSYLY